MIYLDNAATTKIDLRVLDAMMPYLQESYGNAGALYSIGRDARAAVEKARGQVAKFMNADPEQIVFTSGGTEGNNMVFELARQYMIAHDKKTVKVSTIEHDSVLKSAEKMCIKDEFGLHHIEVDEFGRFPLSDDDLKQMTEDTVGLLSFMYMNNEIGIVNDVSRIGEACKDKDILFHTDCVQAASCIPIDVKKLGCDFATISSHKLNGPKGVGAIFIKDKSQFEPLISGGANQEFGMRGGTENVAGIVGLGKACEIITENMEEIEDQLSILDMNFRLCICMAALEYGVAEKLHFNEDNRKKVVNFRFEGVDSETLILMLDSEGIAVSAGSACNSRENTPSHVLKSIGLSDDETRESIRVSFSRMNSNAEATEAAYKIAKCASIILGF